MRYLVRGRVKPGKERALLEAIGTERTPVVDLVCGSLGQGLSGAIGFAMASHLAGEDRVTYAFLSDGEMEEGQTWEAAMFAADTPGWLFDECWEAVGDFSETCALLLANLPRHEDAPERSLGAAMRELVIPITAAQDDNLVVFVRMIKQLVTSRSGF